MKISAALSPVEPAPASGSAGSRSVDYGSEFDSAVREAEKGSEPTSKGPVEKPGAKSDSSPRKDVKVANGSRDADREDDAAATAAAEDESPDGSDHIGASATEDILGRLLAAPGTLPQAGPAPQRVATAERPSQTIAAPPVPGLATAAHQGEGVSADGAAMPDEALQERLIIAPIGAGSREPLAAETGSAKAGGKVGLEVLHMETHFEPRTDDFVLVEGRAPVSAAVVAAQDASLDATPRVSPAKENSAGPRTAVASSAADPGPAASVVPSDVSDVDAVSKALVSRTATAAAIPTTPALSAPALSSLADVAARPADRLPEASTLPPAAAEATGAHAASADPRAASATQPASRAAEPVAAAAPDTWPRPLEDAVAAILNPMPAKAGVGTSRSDAVDEGQRIPVRFDEALARLATRQASDSQTDAGRRDGERGGSAANEPDRPRTGAGSASREEGARFGTVKPKSDAPAKPAASLDPGAGASSAGNGAVTSMTGQVAGRVIDALRPSALGARPADLPPGETHLRLTAGGAALKTLTIQLQPENLGRIEVSMRLVDGQLTLELAATEHETALVLGQDRDGLKKLLEHAGFSLDDASITIVTRDASVGPARAAPGAGSDAGQSTSQGGTSQDGTGAGAGQTSEDRRDQSQPGPRQRHPGSDGADAQSDGRPARQRSSSVFL